MRARAQLLVGSCVLFRCKRLDSGLILMTYEVKPNDQAASRPLMAVPRSSTRDVLTTARVVHHLALRCRDKSNNFTLEELAIVRFRLVCLPACLLVAYRAHYAHTGRRTKGGIEGRGEESSRGLLTFRDYRSLSSSEGINKCSLIDVEWLPFRRHPPCRRASSIAN